MPRDPHAKQTTCGGRGQGPCLPCAGPGPGRGGAPAGLMEWGWGRAAWPALGSAEQEGGGESGCRAVHAISG